MYTDSCFVIQVCIYTDSFFVIQVCTLTASLLSPRCPRYWASVSPSLPSASIPHLEGTGCSRKMCFCLKFKSCFSPRQEQSTTSGRSKREASLECEREKLFFLPLPILILSGEFLILIRNIGNWQQKISSFSFYFGWRIEDSPWDIWNNVSIHRFWIM